MKYPIVYADPAGNITAIVRGGMMDRKERKQVSEEILAEGKAEQVGFEADPILGGDCRLEMMGGEFCGNAVRAMGFLSVHDRYDGGTYQLRVEITGAEKPVPVSVDLDTGMAFASMPLPVGIDQVDVDGVVYPVVRMNGIEHMVVEKFFENVDEQDRFVRHALRAMNAHEKEACGIMFLDGDHMTPVVYVHETTSLVWESSCGSGSVACGWYLAALRLDCQKNVENMYLFHEPGGDIQVHVKVENYKITRILLGGEIELM